MSGHGHRADNNLPTRFWSHHANNISTSPKLASADSKAGTFCSVVLLLRIWVKWQNRKQAELKCWRHFNKLLRYNINNELLQNFLSLQNSAKTLIKMYFRLITRTAGTSCWIPSTFPPRHAMDPWPLNRPI